MGKKRVIKNRHYIAQSVVVLSSHWRTWRTIRTTAVTTAEFEYTETTEHFPTCTTA